MNSIKYSFLFIIFFYCITSTKAQQVVPVYYDYALSEYAFGIYGIGGGDLSAIGDLNEIPTQTSLGLYANILPRVFALPRNGRTVVRSFGLNIKFNPFQLRNRSIGSTFNASKLLFIDQEYLIAVGLKYKANIAIKGPMLFHNALFLDFTTSPYNTNLGAQSMGFSVVNLCGGYEMGVITQSNKGLVYGIKGAVQAHSLTIWDKANSDRIFELLTTGSDTEQTARHYLGVGTKVTTFINDFSLFFECKYMATAANGEVGLASITGKPVIALGIAVTGNLFKTSL